LSAEDGKRVRAPGLGREVGAVAMGTAALGVPYGAPGSERPAPSFAEAVELVEFALESGITLIDTAPAYGEAEAVVGAATVGVDCLVATKVAVPPAGARADVRSSVERSLERLRRNRLDLLQLHNAELEDLRCEDLLAALDELRREGVVSRLGVSVYDEEAALAATSHALFDAVQLPFNVLDRRAEARVLPSAADAGMAVLARSVLLHGALSQAALTLPGQLERLRDAVIRVREQSGVSWAELPAAALAWVASQPGVTCALVGPRNREELAALLRPVPPLLAAAREPLAPELLDPRGWPQGAST
jgi:hypothetical protein